MEDSSDCLPISTSKSESEVKIIGTSAELKREDWFLPRGADFHSDFWGGKRNQRNISWRECREDSSIPIYMSTYTFEVEDEIIRTPAEEIST